MPTRRQKNILRRARRARYRLRKTLAQQNTYNAYRSSGYSPRMSFRKMIKL